MSDSGRVIVVGSANMDLVAYGPRLPSPGETVLAEHFRRSPGGKGANQAVAASRNGADTTFVGAVGEDAFGDEILASLRAAGVKVEHVRRIGAEQTGVALITVDEGGRNLITVVPGANNAVDSQVCEEVVGLLSPGVVVLLQLEIPIETVILVADLAHTAGATVVLNPAPAQRLPSDLVSCVDVLVPNEIELLSLAAAITGDRSFGGLARALLTGATGAVVVTLGAGGVLVVTREEEMRFAALPVKVVDTTGAGDSFVGALASRLAAGDGLAEAVRYANAAAALKVQAKGAQESIAKGDDVYRILEALQGKTPS